MDLLHVLLFSAIAAVIGAFAGFVGCGLGLRNSGPQATAESLAEMSRIRLEWAAWKTGADGILEAMEEVAETVERKRRRVAARESAAARGQGEGANGSSDPRAELRARARALGHPI